MPNEANILVTDGLRNLIFNINC